MLVTQIPLPPELTGAGEALWRKGNPDRMKTDRSESHRLWLRQPLAPLLCFKTPDLTGGWGVEGWDREKNIPFSRFLPLMVNLILCCSVFAVTL